MIDSDTKEAHFWNTLTGRERVVENVRRASVGKRAAMLKRTYAYKKGKGRRMDSRDVIPTDVVR